MTTNSREATKSEAVRHDGDALAMLVRAAAAGDDGGWSGLVARYDRTVRSVARAHRLGHHDVEEVSQITWMRLFQHIDRLRDPAALPGWLWTTARHESLRLLRTHRNESLTDDGAVPDQAVEPPQLGRASSAERRVALGQAVRTLSPRQRSLVGMLLLDPEVSYERISTTLGLPVGSIGPTRARSLERLRRDRHLELVVT